MKTHDEIIRSIGSQLSRRRKDLGWSMRELSRRAGVNISVIHWVESGERKRLAFLTIVSIANALGVDIRPMIEFSFDNVVKNKQ